MQGRSQAALLPILVLFLCGKAAAETVAPPDKLLWSSLKQALTKADADEYFYRGVKDALLPTLKGTLISVQRDLNANPHLELGLADATTPEVTLVLKDRAAESLPQLREGVQIEFEGIGVSYSKNPLHVVFEVEDFDPPAPLLGSLASSWHFGSTNSVTNGRYIVSSPKLEFELPAGWSVSGTRSMTGGRLAILSNPELDDFAAAGIWMSNEKAAGAQYHDRLEKLLAEATGQRSDLTNYAIRSQSVRPTWIGGKEALQAVADYELAGQKMSETLTCIVSERAKVVFFARTTVDRLATLQPWFDRLVYIALVQ